MGGSAQVGYVPAKQVPSTLFITLNITLNFFLKVWLTPQKGKGLEISGTWSLRNNVITMEMTFSNKAMQAMQGFGIQLNKNSFGLTTSAPLSLPVLNANQSLDISLAMTTAGPVQKMDPLTNIQVLLSSSSPPLLISSPPLLLSSQGFLGCFVQFLGSLGVLLSFCLGAVLSW